MLVFDKYNFYLKFFRFVWSLSRYYFGIINCLQEKAENKERVSRVLNRIHTIIKGVEIFETLIKVNISL